MSCVKHIVGIRAQTPMLIFISLDADHKTISFNIDNYYYRIDNNTTGTVSVPYQWFWLKLYSCFFSMQCSCCRYLFPGPRIFIIVCICLAILRALKLKHRRNLLCHTRKWFDIWQMMEAETHWHYLSRNPDNRKTLRHFVPVEQMV